MCPQPLGEWSATTPRRRAHDIQTLADQSTDSDNQSEVINLEIDASHTLNIHLKTSECEIQRNIKNYEENILLPIKPPCG